MSTPITVYGDVDPRAVSQLQRCADAGEALRGALCADGHVGYSQPIGGAVAYADYISPSGVGYDIACIAAGTPVSTADGYFKPIEQIVAGEPVLGWDAVRARVIEPCGGALARGTRELRRVLLALGRELLLTDDHRVRTRLGWKRADELRAGDAVACSPFVGLPFEAGGMAPELLRLVAYCAGDGHLGVDGKTIAWYSNSASDIADLASDLTRLGFPGAVSERRDRGQWVLTRRSVALHERFRELGVPVGKKVDAWPQRPFEWAFDLPPWQRAVFLSAFMSAEGSTPALASGTSYIAALAVKQSGVTDAPIRFVQRLFASLGFVVNVGVSGPPREDGRQSYVAQLQGGEAEILRYLREVGYNRAVAKRRAAAAMLSVAAQREAALPIAVGGGTSFASVTPDHSGEVAWLPVVANELTGTSGAVYDVVTGDPAECFLAGGVVVHNCGNKATRTNLRADDIRADLSPIMDSIFDRISFGVGRKNNEPVDHPVLDAIKDADFEPQRALHETASKQLGTVGAGNHYVDLFEDEEGWVWVGVHFGSRGFGHRTASGFLALAQGLAFDAHAKEGEMDSPPVLLHVDSELGQAYVAAMSLAGEYAYAGRDTVVAKVLEILGAHETESVHNHHNFAWRENHFGTDVWVIRKGCTPAFPGQEGFVGATMGEPSVILRGSDSSGSAELLYSTVHGAGRVMSRTKAAGKLRTRAECSVRDCDTHVPWNKRHDQHCPDHPDAKWVKRRRIVEPGLIDFAAVKQELTTAGIELRGGAADEAPGAYKRLDAVLAAHGDTIEIVHRLTPLGVAMAAAETFDPYKD